MDNKEFDVDAASSDEFAKHLLESYDSLFEKDEVLNLWKEAYKINPFLTILLFKLNDEIKGSFDKLHMSIMFDTFNRILKNQGEENNVEVH